jgi:hypothetical protein
MLKSATPRNANKGDVESQRSKINLSMAPLVLTFDI